MRLYNQDTNNLAVYLGVDMPALGKFLRKFNLNARELEKMASLAKNTRLELISHAKIYEAAGLEVAINAQEKLTESRRAVDFFETTHGKSIYALLNQNGKTFNRFLVKDYLSNLHTQDLKWARLMDRIASDLGLNLTLFKTYAEQEEAMLDAVENLFYTYPNHKENLIISKKAIGELVEIASISPADEIKEEKNP